MARLDDIANYPPGSTPPKSVGQIRKALKSVHHANESPGPGPLTNGLHKDDWIAADSFAHRNRRDATLCGCLLQALERNGIAFETRESWHETIIYVRCIDVIEARKLLDRHMLRDARKPRYVPPRTLTYRPLPLESEWNWLAAFILYGPIGAAVGSLVGGYIAVIQGGELFNASWAGTLVPAGFIAGVTLAAFVEMRRDVARWKQAGGKR